MSVSWETRPGLQHLVVVSEVGSWRSLDDHSPLFAPSACLSPHLPHPQCFSKDFFRGAASFEEQQRVLLLSIIPLQALTLLRVPKQATGFTLFVPTCNLHALTQQHTHLLHSFCGPCFAAAFREGKRWGGCAPPPEDTDVLPLSASSAHGEDSCCLKAWRARSIQCGLYVHSARN